jgi:hypothetical protein
MASHLPFPVFSSNMSDFLDWLKEVNLLLSTDPTWTHLYTTETTDSSYLTVEKLFYRILFGSGPATRTSRPTSFFRHCRMFTNCPCHSTSSPSTTCGSVSPRHMLKPWIILLFACNVSSFISRRRDRYWYKVQH